MRTLACLVAVTLAATLAACGAPAELPREDGVALALALIMVAGLVTAWRQLGDRIDDEPAVAAADECLEGPAKASILADPGIAPALQKIAEDFNKTKPVIRDYCVTVEVRPADARATLEGLTATTWDTKTYGEFPAAWVPQSSIWAATLQTSKAEVFQGKPESLVSSPIRLAMEPEIAEAGANSIAWADLPAQTSGETFDFWERETTALIEEWEAAQAPVVEVELPGELTATDLVNLRADALQFARRQRRPVPFKPNQYAKRGTAFHEWLEDRFGASALLDENELPGIDEVPVDADQLARLKESFLDSEWAERTPEFVEQPFEVSIGDAIVRGRMDAVFRDPQNPDGWLSVDWKTGRPPSGAERKAAIIRLAVYREAWLRILGEEQAPVRAAFHYVGWGETLEPHDLPGREELERLLADAVVDKQ